MRHRPRNIVWAGITALALVAGCRGTQEVRTAKDYSPSKVRRVVVLPFTADPLAPASGLKAAHYFAQGAQERIDGVAWIGPSQVLKEEGIDIGPALQEDTVADAPGAIEPVLNKIFKSTFAVAALDPSREREVARRHQADAYVVGAVYYDPGTGMVEGIVRGSRKPASAVAVQMKETESGRVFLAFNERPQETEERRTMSQVLRQTARSAAEQIGKKWR